MQKSMFFNSSQGDRVYKAEDWADYFSSFIGNGVFPNPSSGLQVMATEGMTINVLIGRAWIRGYFLHNTTDNPFLVSHADGTLPRIDRVVVRWSLADRNVSLQLKSGTFSPTPTPPALQRDADVYELTLADIRVNAGATFIAQEDITDLRLNSELCGMAAGLIEPFFLCLDSCLKGCYLFTFTQDFQRSQNFILCSN